MICILVLVFRRKPGAEAVWKARVTDWTALAIVGAHIITGVIFAGRCFDGLVLGVYDFAGISSVLSSLSREGTWLSSWFYTSANGSTFFLGHHFSPMLAIYAPFYFFTNTHLMYAWLLLGTLAIALAIYWSLANTFQGSALIYLSAFMTLPVYYLFAVSFHFEILFLPCAFLFFLGRRLGNFMVTLAGLVTLLLVKEDAALYLSFYAIYLLASGEKRNGAILLVICVSWFIVATRWIMPGFSGETNSRFLTYWNASSLPELVGNLLRDPSQIVRAWQTGYQAPLALMTSVAFFPLFKPRFALLVLFPIFTIHALSSQPFFRPIETYYMYTVLPYLALGTLEGSEVLISFLQKHAPYLKRAVPILLLCAASWQAALKTTIPQTNLPDGANGKLARALLAKIEPGSLVRTHAFIAAQVPVNVRVSDLKTLEPADYLFIEPGRNSPQGESADDVLRAIETAKKSGRLVSQEGPFSLYRMPGRSPEQSIIRVN